MTTFKPSNLIAYVFTKPWVQSVIFFLPSLISQQKILAGVSRKSIVFTACLKNLRWVFEPEIFEIKVFFEIFLQQLATMFWQKKEPSKAYFFIQISNYFGSFFLWMANREISLFISPLFLKGRFVTTRIQFQALIIDYITILVPVSLKLRNNRFYSINNRL